MTEDIVTFSGRARVRSDVEHGNPEQTRIDVRFCALCGTQAVAAVASLRAPGPGDALALPSEVPVCPTCLALLDSADVDARTALAARLVPSYTDYGRDEVAIYLLTHRIDD